MELDKHKYHSHSLMRQMKNSELYRDCTINFRADEENSRKVHVSFSSEEPVARFWGAEILSHAEGAVDLSRLNEIGVLLFNHDRDQVIGRVEKAWIENSRGEADVVFDDDEASEKIFRKVKSGTLKTTSIGYQVRNWEDVENGATSKDGRFVGPCSIALDWYPFEISIVSVPADQTVGVERSLENEHEAHSLDLYQKQIAINENWRYVE